MSLPSGVIGRLHAGGWMVLASALPKLGRESPRLAEHLLDHLDLGRGCVCVVAPDLTMIRAQDSLTDLEALLDQPVAIVPLEDFTPSRAEDVGLMILVGGPAHAWVRPGPTPGLAQGGEDLGRESSVLYLVGPAAAAAGAWIHDPESPILTPGLGWITNCLVLPGCEDPTELPPVRAALAGGERLSAIGLPSGAVLALGPGREVELWGPVQPRLVLGRGWQNP